MRYEVTLPSMGDDSDESAKVSFWLVKEGEIVMEGDDLIELTTDKAAFTVPSPKTGTLVARTVDEDDDIAAGDVICILEV
ncbi:MAG TPA: hypothetical protein HPP83_01410 [Candidatus Hydrogenedentes bacterium]|nr:hypothetical protein [Candidatus Hydrogenedentota bacterium]